MKHFQTGIWKTNDVYIRGLTLITLATSRSRWGQVCYTFRLDITCKNGERGSRKHAKMCALLMEGPLVQLERAANILLQMTMN